MKNLLCLLILTLFGVAVSGQNVHFVYFETDNAQPFYLKMDDKVYSSTSSGSFVLPNLADTTYNLAIGFPATSTEAKFKLDVSGKDYGYSIKNFDFGMGLFDMQNLSVTKPQADNWKSNISWQYRTNDFTSLLAKASNDTSLFYVPVYLKEDAVVKKPEEKQPEVKKEEVVITPDPSKTDTSFSLSPGSAAVATVAVVKPAEKNGSPFIFPGAMTAVDSTASRETVIAVSDTVLKSDPVATENNAIDSTAQIAVVKMDGTATAIVPDSNIVAKTDSIPVVQEIKEYKRSTVKRHSESSTSEGFGLIFFDDTEEGTDTVRLIIPNPRIVFKEADTTRFEDGMLEIKKDTQAVAPVVEETKAVAPKSNCATAASDNDFFKLRKNMAAKETDDEMIGEAKKVFKSKCFSTGQIKNLGSLFLNDEGKYKFFDAAYMHVTDQEVFYALQAELKDEYYLNRFKALIGK